MDATVHVPLTLDSAEYALLLETLEREQAKLLVSIRHSDNRHFREELHRRLDLLTQLLERLQKS